MEKAPIPQFGVSDFLAVVNQSLEVAFGSIYVEGEVASFKINHHKYVFFDLKDESGSVGCFMTVWQLRIPIEDGMRVVVRAVPKVTPWGKFSLTVTDVRPVGEGSLKKSLEILRDKLSREGLFDAERKRLLPSQPGLVGVISSTAAAGYADFIKIANDRYGGTKFLVTHVQVQGNGAADQIIRAIEHLNQLPELPEAIAIVRGGGSADDLAVFNDELLVRAIAGSRVPVITGIGHEVDVSLADLAADVAAATPSNVAQILLPDKHAMIRTIKSEGSRISDRVEVALAEALEQLSRLKVQSVEAWGEGVDRLLRELTQKKLLIGEYDPSAVLQRGYAILSGKQQVGEVLTVVTKNSIMKARIEHYEKR